MVVFRGESMMSGVERVFVGRRAATLGRRHKATEASPTAADLNEISEVLGVRR